MPGLAGFSEDEGVRPDFEDLSAAAAWSAVMVTLQQHETPHNKCDLHLAAVRAALAQERRLKLPAALLAPFQVQILLVTVHVHRHRAIGHYTVLLQRDV